jgi:hypothetical protein
MGDPRTTDETELAPERSAVGRTDPVALKYRAFLSYSHTDKAWAKWLHAKLEGFRIDKDLISRETAIGQIPKTLRPIFRDREDFRVGNSLNDETIRALDASAALIVLCSPASAKSYYVNEELRLFKSRHPDRPLIPVIVGGMPDHPEECFAPALRFKLGPEDQITNVPEDLLAADVREEGDGRNLAVAKTVARLLDLQTDDVFRRAERERRRQRRIWSAIGLVFICLMTTGAYLYWQWSESDRTAEDRQVPGVRVERRQTLLDLSGWKETTDADIRDKVQKSLAVSTNKFTIVRTHSSAKKFIHRAGTSSKTPPQVECKECKIVLQTSGENRLRFEWNIEFDISSRPLDEKFDIEFKFIFWNAFQTPDQWFGGFRVLHATQLAVYRLNFPTLKRPLAETISYSYVDTTEHAYRVDDGVTLVKDNNGRVFELAWEVPHPDADRSYRVRWDWSK